jgi:hypothetical protein
MFFQIFFYFTAHYHVLDSIPIGIETILIILYIFCLFYEQFQRPDVVSLYYNYWFWFILGILFYLSSTFFFNILANTEKKTAEEYWFLTYIIETIKNIFFAVGMVAFAKQTSDKSKTVYVPNLDFN